MVDTTEYDYSNTPGYRRKVRRETLKAQNKAALLKSQGPITLLILGLIDIFINIFKSVFFGVADFFNMGFNAVYEPAFGSFSKLIPNSEKFGVNVSMKPVRYFITLILPPVGIFMSKGLYGWFNILLCVGLTYLNYFLGVIYAFVITHRNRYADRFEKVEGVRLATIKELAKACLSDDDIAKTEEDNKMFGFTLSVLITVFIGMIISSQFSKSDDKNSFGVKGMILIIIMIALYFVGYLA